ncbi:hypothetical protein KAT36_03495 [Candidatus Pacearchaeota archaeon]|nr:hypothetical protein [Candidatus Pacearchaeota archaeon]
MTKKYNGIMIGVMNGAEALIFYKNNKEGRRLYEDNTSFIKENETYLWSEQPKTRSKLIQMLEGSNFK